MVLEWEWKRVWSGIKGVTRGRIYALPGRDFGEVLKKVQIEQN
jgi:hypothetical protein